MLTEQVQEIVGAVTSTTVFDILQWVMDVLLKFCFHTLWQRPKSSTCLREWITKYFPQAVLYTLFRGSLELSSVSSAEGVGLIDCLICTISSFIICLILSIMLMFDS